MLGSEINCWICGNPASTREHPIKQTDLSKIFGKISPGAPLYFHSPQRGKMNFPVRSLKARVLKSPAKICIECNSSRTQPHDKAWEKYSDALTNRGGELVPGRKIRADKVFKFNASHEMLNVHLYFLKIFGCDIVHDNVPIDISEFAKCIKKGVPHPYFYIQIGPMPKGSALGVDLAKVANSSNIDGLIDQNGRAVFAKKTLWLGVFAVNLIFAESGFGVNDLVDAWHPRQSNNLTLMRCEFAVERWQS